VTQRGPFLFLIALLLLVGLASAIYRQQAYLIPLLPGAQLTVWQVEARIEYFAQGGPSQAYLTLPPEQDGFRLIKETGASPGFGFSLETDGRQRRAHWTKRDAQGQQLLFYKLDLVSEPDIDVDDRSEAPAPDILWDEPYATASEQLLAAAMPVSADALSLARQLIRLLNRVPADQNVSLLRDRFSDPDLLAALLQTAGERARTVQVLELEDGRRRQQLRDYVQVWQGDDWHLFNPRLGPVSRTDDLLLWQTTRPAVLEVMGGVRSSVSFSMISQTRSALSLMQEASREQAGGFDFSLYSLPIADQGSFKLIMLLPVGALMVVVMRLLVGVKTSGTFMPVLIALAFLQTELIPGVVSFVLVVMIGLLLRYYLSELRLLLVARIAVLVIIVVAIITAFSIVSYRLGLMAGLSITFFPMIILAWTIERMSILWEEQGPREVLVQGGGSLLVAVLAFLAMDQPLTRHLAFNFPELHLCTLAIIMMLGRYTGYRLLELRRFASFKALQQ